jgi:hypothetical protein
MKALVAMIAAAVLMTASAPAYAKFCYKNGKPYLCSSDSDRVAEGKKEKECEPKA